MSKKEAKRFELFISYAIASTRMAVDDSGLQITEENGGRVAASWPGSCTICRTPS